MAVLAPVLDYLVPVVVLVLVGSVLVLRSSLATHY